MKNRLFLLLTCLALIPSTLLTEETSEKEKADAKDKPHASTTSPPATPAPDKRLASGDLHPDEEHEKACGALAVGLDPDMAASERENFETRNHFAIAFQKLRTSLALISTSVMPGESIVVSADSLGKEMQFKAEAQGGSLEEMNATKWKWTAPEETGHHCVHIIDEASGETTCLNVFVMVPYDGSKELNGYQIGEYQTKPLRGLEAYKVPDGFIEVTQDNQDVWVSPHFQLRQFLCRQKSDYPKYLRLDPKLLIKLELILQEVQQAGIAASSFYVVSGYRTPYYNSSIGNKTKYSRHFYGDAADIFVDIDGDGKMDDLNDDDEVTNEDPRYLYDLVDSLVDQKNYQPYKGGLGFYGMNEARTGFIHVDVRGQKVRW